jgi:Holliday junction DNA helicase RuvA
LAHKAPDGVEVITEGGVGYELQVPTPLLERLPGLGEEVELHTSLLVRDDGMELFGFETPGERELFRRLQNASGVGPRLALAMLSSLPVTRIVGAIRTKDHSVLQTVSGVGRKTAERIALELADKLDDLATEEIAAAATPTSHAALQALRSLGYGAVESQEAVARATAGLDGRDVSTEELIRLALQEV